MTVDKSEHAARLARAQRAMADHGLDALLLTTEPEIRWFTGFLTRFWESPTRPWFLLVPANGAPVAVIPAIGASLMAKCAVSDIRTWAAPDLDDDGVSLLAATLSDITGTSAKIGVPDGHETHLRMPLADFARLKALCPNHVFTSDRGIMRAMRMIKSDADIAGIEAACAIADRAFARVQDFAHPGVPLETVFRRFQMAALDEGADWVAYLAGGAGPDGYDDVISPATSAPLQAGDILMLDTGLVRNGWFCDFDRNFAIGQPSQLARDAHARLIDAVDAAVSIARPGIRACDLFHAMAAIVSGGAQSDAGRLGHGLGMQLTEWPSLIPDDKTLLETGMVLTLEPGIETRDGRIMVHEENIAITETGARFLSSRWPRDIAVIDP